MEITEVRVRQVQNSTDRLKAFCTVTFDDQFVVRDIKVVEGTNGLFVSMPSRKATAACGKCGHRNQIRARFCEDCGARMAPLESPPVDANGRSKLHRDIAHPITPEFRELLQARVLEAFATDQENAPHGEFEGEEDGVAEQAGEPEEVIEEQPPERAVSEYDDLIAGLRGAPDVGREPQGRGDDRGNGGSRGYGERRDHGEARGREDNRPREQARGDGGSRSQGDARSQGESRGRGPTARPVSGNRGPAPREGDRPASGRDAGPARSGGDATRRPREGGPPPRRTGSGQPPRYLRDEQPPRAPGSMPHGERGNEAPRVPQREPARHVAPRETPREQPPRDVPKGPPPSQISLKEADEHFAVDAGGEEEDAPFGAGL